MKFYLGTHKAAWLEQTDVPLFLSRRTLADRKRLPRARGPWALDSGGFTELLTYGTWRTSPEQYVDEVRRFASKIGYLEWAAIQDWMCEPMVRERTGLSVEEHQRRTIDSLVTLRKLAPEIPWAPVLQGQGVTQYWRHEDDYAAAGVDLSKEHVVGVGSVCRHQDTTQASNIITTLAAGGLQRHGFGLKIQGLQAVAQHLVSADSMAWSVSARKSPPLPECSHASCANCLRYALEWHEHVLAAIERGEPTQGLLFSE